jgi:hypothetical protein
LGESQSTIGRRKKPQINSSVTITSTRSISTNARLRWEYRPGSELFLVYDDDRNTLTPGYPDLVNRTFILKVNRLFRF